MHIDRTTGVVSKVTEQALVDFTNVGGEYRRYDFTKTIHWLIDSESQVLFMHGGKELKKGACYNDYYGYLSSAENAVIEVADTAESYAITNESSLELVIIAKVFECPMLVTEETIRDNKLYAFEDNPRFFARTPDSWRFASNEEGVFHSLEKLEVGSDIVWSSKNTQEENDALLASFRMTYSKAAMKCREAKSVEVTAS